MVSFGRLPAYHSAGRRDERSGHQVDYVLEFDVPDELIVDRIVGAAFMRRLVVFITLNSIRRK